jgi:hypothetical protein
MGEKVVTSYCAIHVFTLTYGIWLSFTESPHVACASGIHSSYFLDVPLNGKCRATVKYSRRYSVVSIATKFCTGFDFRRQKRYLSSPKRPYRLCDLFRRCRRFFFQESCREGKVTTYPHFVPMLRMSEIVSPRRHMPSWCAQKPCLFIFYHEIPGQAWTGPEGSRRLRLPELQTVGTWRW